MVVAVGVVGALVEVVAVVAVVVVAVVIVCYLTRVHAKRSKARRSPDEHVAACEQGWSLARGDPTNASFRPTLGLGQDDSVTMG